MVKPPLRTKSIGFKVSEEEYALLETAAQADGRTLGEWCREAILRVGSASDDPALAEIVGVRLLLVNVLRPLAAGEKLAPEAFDKMLNIKTGDRRDVPHFAPQTNGDSPSVPSFAPQFRPILSQRLQGPSATNYDTREIDYNSLGQAVRSTMPFSAPAGGTSSTAPGTSATYDALSRVLSVSDANGGQVAYKYTNNDVLQTVSGTQSFQKQFEYDGLGRLTSVCEMSTTLPGVVTGGCAQTTTQTGYWTRYQYDALGRLTGVCQNTTAALGTNCVTSPSANQQTRTFTYDRLGRMLTESNPETGNNAVNGTITYTYDSVSSCGGAAITSKGDLVQKADNAGNSTCYTYDSVHRILTAGNNTISGATLRKFVYDSASGTPPTGWSPSTSNPKTHMIEATTTSTSGTTLTDEWFSYDARGGLTDVYESTPHSGGFYHTTAAYWPTGMLKALSGIPGVPAISYGGTTGAGLDGEGRITQVTAASGANPVTAVTYSTSSTTNFLGALTKVTFGSLDNDSFTYDSNTGHMKSYTFSVNSVTDKGTLTWNTNGTLGKLVIADALNTGDSQTCNYSYDDLARVTAANCGSVWNQSFTYDAFGNISKSGSLGFLPTYSNQNQFTSIPGVTTPYYDSNGNVIKDNLNTYTWDPNWGTMLSVNTGAMTVAATYDALGRMVEQQTGSTFTEILYSPAGKTALMTGQTLTKAFVQLPGGGTAIYNSSGLASYRQADWLGSSRLTSTASRAVFSDLAYAPFGEQYQASGTADPSFTSQNSDTVGSLYDFLFREDSMSQGRWVSSDPLGFAAADPTNPQSWNRYAYVANNPLTYIDPLGLTETCTLHSQKYYVDGQQQGIDVWWECTDDGGGGGGGGGGQVGGGGGGGPANNGTPQTPQQKKTQCLNNFYNSKLGTAAKFGSPLALLPGWNPQWGSNLQEWGIAIFGKLGGLFGSGAMSGTTQLTTLSGTVTVGSKLELGTGAVLGGIEKAAWPAMAGATLVDVGAHLNCEPAEPSADAWIQGAATP